MEKEIWKELEEYNGVYLISSFGNVIRFRNNKMIDLKKRLNQAGYLRTTLHLNGKRKTIQIHQLVAIAFLGHVPCGMELVINHKDFNKQNNMVTNLEIVTNRENSNRQHIKSSSKYVGVDYMKSNGKFRARIVYKGSLLHIGLFENELEASKAYLNKLKEINNG